MRPAQILRQIFCLGLTLVFLCRFPASIQAFQETDVSAVGLTHYTMGLIYDLNGLTEEAIAEYKKAAERDDDSYLIHLKLGASYARLGMMPEAIRELKLVSKYNVDDLQAHYLLALIYSTKKDYDLAADEYEFILKSFVKSEPQNIEVYGYLGQLYYSQKKFDKAIEQFERILTIEPKNAEVMYLLGSLYLDKNERQKAVDLFAKSIEIDPDHDGSLNSLGYIYAEDNVKLDEALEFVQRAVKIAPDNGAYLDSLGWIYYKKGMYDEALSHLEKADSYLKDPTIYDHLGDVYYEMNQPEKAKKYWRMSLDLLPLQEKVSEKLKRLEKGLTQNHSANNSVQR